MDFLSARHAEDGNAHIYHYGAMEVSTLKRLMGRYGTRENELDDLLRHEAFVDLSGIVRQGMRISHSSYGLKKVETFYDFAREATGVAEAGGAVLAYEQWLDTRNEALLDEIRGYNREDCLSIIAMRQWLIEVRPDDVEWKARRTHPSSPKRESSRTRGTTRSISGWRQPEIRCSRIFSTITAARSVRRGGRGSSGATG